MRHVKSTMHIALLCAFLLATGALYADGGLAINAPLELQVFQRDDKNQAWIAIAGAMNEEADVIEAKADLATGAEHGEAVGWTVIARGTDTVDGKFTAGMTLKAGGWYTIAVRARRGEDVVVEATIAKVGVGEVFVTAGQSNSANFGKPRQAATDSRVVYFNGKAFVPANDPIPGACGGGGSPWPILGDQIAASQQVPVCFRSASLTWTEVKNWLPGVPYKQLALYDNLVQCVRQLPQGGVRAVLWHQGESDSLAKTSAETYYERLKTIVETLNKDAGCNIPWFVSRASFHPGSKEPEEQEVAQGQQLLWQRKIALQGPNTDELGQEYRSDRVHFNQKGLTEHADRWFKALAAEYNWQEHVKPRKER